VKVRENRLQKAAISYWNQGLNVLREQSYKIEMCMNKHGERLIANSFISLDKKREKSLLLKDLALQVQDIDSNAIQAMYFRALK
jgi:hypothetical protein